MYLRYRHVDGLGEKKNWFELKKNPPKYELYGQM